MKRNLLMMALVMSMTMLPASVSTAAQANIDVPTAAFAVAKLGDITIVLRDGEPHAIVATGQKFKGMDVYFTVNGAPYVGKAILTSNLTLMQGTMPLKFEHDGTFDFIVGEHTLSLKYEGVATKTKEFAGGMKTKTLNSYGDFVVTDGTGGFEALKGGEGTYTLTLVCSGMAGEHPKVGKVVHVTFSTMSK
jgi:hypothetical protein